MSRLADAKRVLAHLVDTLPEKLRGAQPTVSTHLEYTDLPLNTPIEVAGVPLQKVVTPLAPIGVRECAFLFELWFHAMITGHGENVRIRDFRTSSRRHLCDFVCDEKSEGPRAARMLHAFALSTGAETVQGEDTFLLSKKGVVFGVQDGVLVSPRRTGYVVGRIDAQSALSRTFQRVSNDAIFNNLLGRVRRLELSEDEAALIALRRDWFDFPFRKLVKLCARGTNQGTHDLQRAIVAVVNAPHPLKGLRTLLVPHWMTRGEFGRLVVSSSDYRNPPQLPESTRERVLDNLFSHFNL